MVTQAPSRSSVAIAIMFVLSCIGLIVFVWGKFGGNLPLEPKGYRFKAAFTQASQLTTNADVRMAGVNVGKVKLITQRGDRAVATIQLDPKYAPISDDARAILRQKTLLGETFVSLTPGSENAAKIPEGGQLATKYVRNTTQLDTVLGSFDPKTQKDLQRLLLGFSHALDGRGQDLNDALGNLNPTLGSLDTLVSLLDKQRPDVSHAIRDTGTVLQTVGDRRTDVTSLVNAGDDVLSATAARDKQLTATIKAMPPFLAELQRSLVVVDRVTGDAGPTIKALKPVAPLVRPALDTLIRLSPQIQGVMRQVGPIVTSSQTALPAIGDVVTAAVPFVDGLYAQARQVAPVIKLGEQYGPSLSAVFANVGAATQATTTTSSGEVIHQLRVLGTISDQTLTGSSTRSANNRHNAYPAPGILTNVGGAGLAASDCRNATAGSSNVPCRVQVPFSFDGKTRYYPQLVPTGPAP